LQVELKNIEKMKKLLMLVCSLQLLLIVIGCSKDQQILTENCWEVESMKIYYADSTWVHFPILPYSEIFTLEFFDKNGFRVSSYGTLSCGKVKIGKNQINFFDIISVGFDDTFSQSWLSALTNTNYYEIHGEQLLLRGDNGEFNFKRR